MSDNVIGKDDDVPTVVKKFLQTKIIDAVSETRIMGTDMPKFDEIFELLREESIGFNPNNELKKRGLKLPSPCNVLHIRPGLEDSDEPLLLVPSTPVAAFVFRHNCNAKEAVDALRELVQNAKSTKR